MAYEYIDREECIGDSLFKINNNAANFDFRLNSISTDLTTTTQTLSSQIYRTGSVLAVSFHSFSDSTTRTGDLKNYTPATNGTISVLCTRNNSRFLVTVNGQGYAATGANGANIGIDRNIGGTITRLLGVDGTTGDAWMGTSNGHIGAFSITRSFLDTPGRTAGTIIQYRLLHGHWAAGSTFINYPGYTGQSSIVVQEIV